MCVCVCDWRHDGALTEWALCGNGAGQMCVVPCCKCYSTNQTGKTSVGVTSVEDLTPFSSTLASLPRSDTTGIRTHAILIKKLTLRRYVFSQILL
jgi:hypothetical protein